jgi:hypothetical protein
MLQMGTNIMANQVKTPIQNYFEKVLYGNLSFVIPPLWFFRIEWKQIRNKPLWFTGRLPKGMKCEKNAQWIIFVKKNNIKIVSKHNNLLF